MAPLLQITQLSMQFGGLRAIDGVSFGVGAHAITALIGPNGAGKTTLFNCITGFYKPHAGTIVLSPEPGLAFALHDMAPHQIAAQARLVRSFQNIRLFAGMSVLENLLVAQHHALGASHLAHLRALLPTKTHKAARVRAIDRARFWLDRVGLWRAADDLAGRLPYGAQRHLEIARAMCAGPRLLCLDEPAAGLNPAESARLADLLSYIKREHCAVLLIDHDMTMVMGLCDHIVVLDHGTLIAQGDAAAIRRHPAVIAAYLGEEAP